MGFTFDGQEKILELGKPIKKNEWYFILNNFKK